MKRTLQIIGGIVILIVILLGAVVGFVFAQSSARLNQQFEVYDVVQIDTSSVTDDMLLEAERLFISRGCSDCHGEDGGGTLFIDDPALGVIPGSNLTAGEGGVGQTYTRDDYVRAIQHGIRPDGSGLFVMPSEDWQQMREEELTLLIAYIESLEPVDNVLPELQLGPIGRVLVTLGQFDYSASRIDHENAGLVDVAVGATVEYGQYLASGCIGCHGTDFAGGIALEPGAPPSSNLTPHADGIGNWTAEDFINTIRTGINPDGHELSLSMPWPSLARMTDEELEALYLYFQSLDPVEGN